MLNTQFADRSELLQEARRLSKKVSVRIQPFLKRGVTSHAMDLLQQSRYETFEGTSYQDTLYGVSKSMTDSQLRRSIHQFRRFLNTKTSSYRNVMKTAKDITNGKIKGTKNLAEVLRFVENTMDSVSKLMEHFDSQTVKEFWEEVKYRQKNENLNPNKVYAKLAEIYASKDESQNVTRQELFSALDIEDDTV